MYTFAHIDTHAYIWRNNKNKSFKNINHQQNQTPRAWQFSVGFKQHLLGSEIAVFDVPIFIMRHQLLLQAKCSTSSELFQEIPSSWRVGYCYYLVKASILPSGNMWLIFNLFLMFLFYYMRYQFLMYISMFFKSLYHRIIHIYYIYIYIRIIGWTQCKHSFERLLILDTFCFVPDLLQVVVVCVWVKVSPCSPGWPWLHSPFSSLSKCWSYNHVPSFHLCSPLWSQTNFNNIIFFKCFVIWL